MKLAQPSQSIVGLGKNVRKKKLGKKQNVARSKLKQEDKQTCKKLFCFRDPISDLSRISAQYLSEY